MATVCPQCQQPYPSGGPCPQCPATPLRTATMRSEPVRPQTNPEAWKQSPAGRLVLGLLVALGLCFGLLQLFSATLRALGIEATGAAFNPLVSLAFFQGLQALALLVGGMLAGAGKTRGAALGALVGALTGILVLLGVLNGLVIGLIPELVQELFVSASPLRNVALYGLPLLHVGFGAIGGFLGRMIWQPPQDLGPVLLASGPLGGIQGRLGGHGASASSGPSRWDGPVAWGRVLLGTVLAFAGAVWTPSIIHLILSASDGKLTVVTSLEDQVTYAEVFALTLLTGGFLAGINRVNGMKQGFCVGMATAVMVAVLVFQGTMRHPIPDAFLLASPLILGTVGGWFGSELLPPLAPRRRRRWDNLA